jgi:hypothetical protein
MKGTRHERCGRQLIDATGRLSPRLTPRCSIPLNAANITEVVADFDGDGDQTALPRPAATSERNCTRQPFTPYAKYRGTIASLTGGSSFAVGTQGLH